MACCLHGWTQLTPTSIMTPSPLSQNGAYWIAAGCLLSSLETQQHAGEHQPVATGAATPTFIHVCQTSVFAGYNHQESVCMRTSVLVTVLNRDV